MNLTMDQIAGKTDLELFSPDPDEYGLLAEKQAYNTKEIIEYISSVILNDKRVNYIAVKWVVYYSSGEPFCLCTMADVLDNEEYVRGFRKKVEQAFSAILMAE